MDMDITPLRDDITVTYDQSTDRWTVELGFDDLATVNGALIVAGNVRSGAPRYHDVSDRLEIAIESVSS